ncbi:uncharacterized protein [Typha angustifolia]|uniref:uncharacterized protein n=1 Tax=Typha angustifolia TaxID=59011 RepID=UPI003C2D2D9A
MGSSGVASEEKLLEVLEPEVVVDFKPNAKCRTSLHLRSLHPSLPVYFKVQTSSPHKFHVNPPSGLLPPLSSSLLQIILLPQPHPPPSFPRSSSDRFLILSSLSPSQFHHPPPPSSSIRLRVAFAGPFLLRLAAESGDSAAARLILRRQPHLLPLLDHQIGDGGDDPIGWTPIHAAAAKGDLEELSTRLAEEEATAYSVDARDGEGRTALHVAAGRGHVGCVRLLVEKGADKDARGGDGRTAMYRAAANGDAEMVAALVEMGADVGPTNGKGRTPLDVARDKGHQEVVDILERGEMVMTASRRGDLRRLESLLKKRIGIHGCDQYGMTALHSAAIKGHCDAMTLLIEFGMDMECKDVEGHTPLHLAVESGCLEAVELLIDMGADVNAKTKRGATPLHMATSMGYDGISQLLVTRGATSSSCMASSSSSSISCN